MRKLFEPITKKNPTKNIKNHEVIEYYIFRI